MPHLPGEQISIKNGFKITMPAPHSLVPVAMENGNLVLEPLTYRSPAQPNAKVQIEPSKIERIELKGFKADGDFAFVPDPKFPEYEINIFFTHDDPDQNP